tara:strand:- start:6293 stop:7546 length:1254 start_codon:yes stop_codon:yes gene_type:complete
LKKYKVYKHQNKFIRSKDKFPALVAGYGSGKTVAFCLKGILEAGRNPYKQILLAEPVYPMVKNVLQPTLEACLQDLGFDYNFVAGDRRYTIFWNGGQSDIILSSAENWRRWAGLNLAAGGIDEAALLKDDGAWKMLISRLRDGHHLTAFTTTTPEGFNWVYDHWVEKKIQGYQLIKGKTTDNKHLPPEFVETLKQNYDEKLISAYIEGEFVNLQYGQTYYNFNREKNVVPVQYEPQLPVRVGLDFNVEPMAAVLWQRWNTNPKIRVFDEVEISHSGGNEVLTERMITTILSKYPNAVKYIFYPDPSGKQRRTSAYSSDHDIIEQVMKERRINYDMKVKRQAPSVIDRVNSVNKAMETIKVDPRCIGFIKDLEQTVNKDGTREIDKSKKDRTHFTDAFGYSIDIEMPVRKINTRTYIA